MTRHRVHDRFWNRAFLPFIFFCALLPQAQASSPPDWLRQVLTVPAPENKTADRIMLLDYEQVTYLPQEKIHVLVRKVLKILDDNGLSNLPTGFRYNADVSRVTKARAWIGSADGENSQAYSKNDFIDNTASISQYVWNDLRVISFPPQTDMAVGGTIAWEYEIDTTSGTFDSNWSFQTGMPVVKSHFEVIPCPGGALRSHVSSSQIPEGTADPTSGGLTWEMANIPVATGTLPQGFIPKSLWVSVRCFSPDNPGSKIQTWADFAELASNIIEPRSPANAVVAEKAASLVKGKIGRWDRIRAITGFVQKEITYLSLTLEKDSLAGYRPHRPDEVLQGRLGDCKDKATLVTSMLRSIGEQAFVVLLYSGNPRFVDRQWPSARFNHAIVAIAADADTPASWPQIDGGALGKWVLFDATDEDTPLGVLPESDQGGFGVFVAKKGPGLVQLPLEAPDDKKITRQIKGTVSAEGDLRAEMDETRAGSAAGSLHRSFLRLGNEKFSQQIEAMFHRAMPLVKDLGWKLAWDPKSEQCRLGLHFSTPKYARRLSEDLMLMCPQLLNDQTDFSPWKTKRPGIAWLAPSSLHEEVRLHLPEGFAPEDLPSEWHQTLPNATSSVRYRIEGADLVYESEVTRQGGEFDKEAYDSLRAFYQKLSEAQHRFIVLRRRAQTTGRN